MTINTPPLPPVSPDSGPTDAALPKLPAGWIAQWDNSSRKYYYVQISTGVSQWDLPTSEAPIGGGSHTTSHAGTPAQNANPYDKPAGTEGPGAGDGTRGVDGQTGDRGGGLGGFAMNALTGGGKQNGKQSGGGNLVGQLAGSLLGGGKQGKQSGSGGSGNLVGQLAGSLLGGGKQSHANQSGHGSPAQGGASHGSGGLGGLLGGVLGGGSHNKPSSDYGYSHNSAQGNTYSGTAPPASYQPSAAAHGSTPGQHNNYSSPSSAQYGQPQHGQPQQAGYGQQGGYGGPPPAQQHYSSPPPGQHQAGQYPGGHGQYPPQPQQHGSYGGNQGYGQQAGYGGPGNHQQGSYGGQQHSAPYGMPQGVPQGVPQNYDQHQHNQYGGGHNQYPPPPQHQQSYGQNQGHGGPPQPGWH